MVHGIPGACTVEQRMEQVMQPPPLTEFRNRLRSDPQGQVSSSSSTAVRRANLEKLVHVDKSISIMILSMDQDFSKKL